MLKVMLKKVRRLKMKKIIIENDGLKIKIRGHVVEEGREGCTDECERIQNDEITVVTIELGRKLFGPRTNEQVQ